MQNKITIADAPDCLNTNDKAMWVLGYQAALAARSTCLHQIQVPSATEQAAWHAGLDDGRAQAGFTVSNAETPQAAPAAVAGPDERAAFETTNITGRYYRSPEPGRADEYADSHTQLAWKSWQARAALAATPAAAQFVDQISANLIDKARSPETVIDKAAAPVVLPEPDFWVRPGATIHPDRGWQCWSNDGTATGAFHAATVRALLATATGLPAQAVLDYPWRDRLLDGRELVRDQQGFAEHPELPLLDEGMKPRAFFAALGVEMKHTMAEDDLSMDEYDAMNDAVNWSAWAPRPPIGDAWNLVAIFDTEDGPAAWWARAQETTPPAAQDAREFWGVIAPCGEGVFFKNEADARWTQTGHGSGSDGFGVPTIGEAFRESYEDDALDLVRVHIVAATTAKGE